MVAKDSLEYHGWYTLKDESGQGERRFQCLKTIRFSPAKSIAIDCEVHCSFLTFLSHCKLSGKLRWGNWLCARTWMAQGNPISEAKQSQSWLALGWRPPRKFQVATNRWAIANHLWLFLALKGHVSCDLRVLSTITAQWGSTCFACRGPRFNPWHLQLQHQ